MKVKKSLNNSMLLVEQEQRELILIGKGIGFGTKPGAAVDMKAIEQVFIPLEGFKTQHFLSLTDTVPAAYFDLAHDIIALAQKQYVEKLNNVLFFTLAEHLFYAIERCKAGNSLVNKLNWEVKRYYPREYQIGVQARDFANERFRVALDDDEAVHIAFHLINASGDPDSGDAHQQVQLVNRIAEIVRYKLNRNIDINSVNYNRFITHLRYFAERVIAQKVATQHSDDFYHEMVKFHPQAMSIACTVRDYIQEKYEFRLPNDELTWIGIHISRLADNNV